MSYQGTSYEQLAESGDLASTFDFSEKSIRHGNIDIILFFAVCTYSCFTFIVILFS